MQLRIILVCFSALLWLPNFIDFSFEKRPLFCNSELYEPGLNSLNSLSKIIEYTDSVADARNVKKNCPEYGVIVSNTIKKRFYHGFSVLGFKENWLASLTQKCLGKNLAKPVEPDEILTFPFAGCSQQVIILMSIMKAKNIPYRSVGFPHHYAVELFLNKAWYFFDPDMEPNMLIDDRLEKNWKRSPDSLKKYYQLSQSQLNWGLGTSSDIQVGAANAAPAPNAKLFQKITFVLSRTLWLLPLLLAFSIKPVPVRQEHQQKEDYSTLAFN